MVPELQGTLVRKFGDWCSYSGTMMELGPIMWRSNHDVSSVSISPRLDKIATHRRPHGGVAVQEAMNKSVNTAKNK